MLTFYCTTALCIISRVCHPIHHRIRPRNRKFFVTIFHVTPFRRARSLNVPLFAMDNRDVPPDRLRTRHHNCDPAPLHIHPRIRQQTEQRQHAPSNERSMPPLLPFRDWIPGPPGLTYPLSYSGTEPILPVRLTSVSNPSPPYLPPRGARDLPQRNPHRPVDCGRRYSTVCDTS